MAKLLPYYSLCPLIEEENFLGISKDADSDTVLVTPNTNIIARYRLSDPKQISSWNCKGSLTSAAVYDFYDEQYAAVFNYKEIRKWSITDESIDNVKKYKFAEKLLGLLVTPENGKAFVVFDKGYVLPLNDAIDKRKELFNSSRLEELHRIIFYDVAVCLDGSIIILLVHEGSTYRILGISVNDPNNLAFDVPVKYSDGKLLGYCLYVDKQCHFISLWSDGKLYRDSTFSNQVTAPYHYVATIDSLNLHKPIVIKMLSSHYLAICGEKEDGLLLIIYDVKFNLIQCQQFYENCRSTPQLWNFNTKLCLIMGHNLVVVPYVEEHRNLSTLIGCNTHLSDSNTEDVLPESKVYKTLLAELLEENDSNRILEIIKFDGDIPDSALINILIWSIKNREFCGNILDVVLNNCCAHINNVSLLRSYCTMEKSLEILDYIMMDIRKNRCNFKLLKWALLLIDAFYQQYVMLDDKSILKKLESYSDVLQNECVFLKELEDLWSLASCINRKTNMFSK